MRTREKTIFQIIIFSIAFLILVNIWPIGNIKNHDVSKAKDGIVYYETQAHEDKIITHVIFQEEHLDSITQKIEIEQYNEVDRVTFRLLDKDFKPVATKLVRVELIARDKQVKLLLDVDVVPGENYFYEWLIPEVDEDDGELPIVLKLPMGYKEKLSQAENQATYINEAGTIEYAFVADYDYTREWSALSVIIFSVCIIGIAFALNLLVVKVIDETSICDIIDRKILLIKKLITFVVALCTAAAFILSVFINIWGGNIDDRIVYAVGILSLSVWILFAIWHHNVDRHKEDKGAVLIWKDYIQIVCFAMAIYSACRYVNAEYELIHVINTRRIVTYLLLAYAMMLDRHNRPKIKIWRNVNLGALIVWIVLMVIMNINKADLTWPPVMILFGIPFIFKMSKEGQRRLLNNFSWGVYVSFFITSGYCLLHRPYNTWIFYRYPGMFHTVAYTGMYLCIVAAVSAARVLIKKKPLDCFIFTMSVGYIFLSMTRAAILSIALAYTIAFFMVVISRKDFIGPFKHSIVLLVLCILGFCTVFSATRMIPAIVNEPVYMDVENTESFGVCKGDSIDSSRYLRFNRYAVIMFGRFGKALYTNEDARNEAETLVVSLNRMYLPVLSVSSQTNESNLSGDISNGRIQTFKAFIENISFEPHDEFSLEYEGEEYAHAHNAFLQVAYLFGLLGGIVFLLLCIYTLILGFYYFVKNKEDKNSLVPIMLTVAFLVTSCIEWTYQPGIPIGFAFMFIQMFLTKRAVEGETDK